MTTATATPTAPRGGRWRVSEEVRWAFIFILPWILGFVVFTAGPMLWSLYLSFTDYNVIRPPVPNGLENYEDLVGDRRVWTSLANTLYYTAFNVPGTIILSLALAMMLLRVGRSSGLFRTAFYLPNMTPAVAVGTLFMLLLAGNGLINSMLGAVGIPGPNWLTDPDWIKPSVIIMSLWTLGSTVVIYFAALRNVPIEIYEAARIDGASAWQSFRSITVPYISGAIFFTVIVNTIASLQIFAEVYTVFFGDRSGPGQQAALFYTIYLFRRAFEDLDLGYASALAWVLFAVILVITVIQVVVSRRLVFYAGDK